MFKIIVPTLNAAGDWPEFASALLACVGPEDVLILDSESDDGTRELARLAGFRVVPISQREFSHGGTRTLGARLADGAEILVYMTQDAVLAGPNEIRNLISVFEDGQVAAACGRQLPRRDAGPIEAHARQFNYPATSFVREFADRQRLGIKAAFLSNSFAAYRRSALMAAGGFPEDVIFGEDMLTAARLLMMGHKVAYVANACVYHSHAYSVSQEFRRFFDIGVLHSREQWLIETFGKPSGEGYRYVVSEIECLRKTAPGQIPSAVLRTGCKLLAYRLGLMEGLLRPGIKRRLSMHPKFWANV